MVGVVIACPQGDGTVLEDAGLTITVTLFYSAGFPIAGYPASLIRLTGCNGSLGLCGGGEIHRSGPTEANGQTTFTGTIDALGCYPDGLRVVAGGTVIGGSPLCPMPCLPIKVLSVDQKNPQGGSADGMVTVADFAFFGLSYPSPPKPYFACHDFSPTFQGGPYGTITLADYAMFGQHFGHSC